jgi:hypothetical protein
MSVSLLLTLLLFSQASGTGTVGLPDHGHHTQTSRQHEIPTGQVLVPLTLPDRDAPAQRPSTPHEPANQWWTATWADWTMAAFALAVAIISYLQKQATDRTNQLLALIERSYIAPTHTQIKVLQPGKVVSIRVSLMNSGRSSAVITKGLLKLWCGPTGLRPVPIAADEGTDEHVVDTGVTFIPPGLQHSLDVTFDSWIPNDTDYRAIDTGRMQLWVVAHCEWRDDLSQPRVVRFARRWDPLLRQFITVNDRFYHEVPDERPAQSARSRRSRQGQFSERTNLAAGRMV